MFAMYPLLRLLAFMSVGICHSFIVNRRDVCSSRGGLTILVERPSTNDGSAGSSHDNDRDSDPITPKRGRQWWNLFRRRIFQKNSSDRFVVEHEQEPQSSNLSRRTTSLGRRFQRLRKWQKRLVMVVCVFCALLAVSPIMPWDVTPENDSWNASDARPAISRPAPHASTKQVIGQTASAEGSTPPESLALNNAPAVVLEKYSTRSLEAAVARKNKVLVGQVEGSIDEKGGDLETKQNAVLDRRHAVLSFVTEAVEKVGPSVVRIDTESSLFGEDSGLSTAGFVQQGQGSGLIFTKEGLILTNAHVVEDASKVTVTLTDGRVFDAEVCGTDEIVDIGTYVDDENAITIY
jgi:Trypsin-like peptidase domain